MKATAPRGIGPALGKVESIPLQLAQKSLKIWNYFLNRAVEVGIEVARLFKFVLFFLGQVVPKVAVDVENGGKGWFMAGDDFFTLGCWGHFPGAFRGQLIEEGELRVIHFWPFGALILCIKDFPLLATLPPKGGLATHGYCSARALASLAILAACAACKTLSTSSAVVALISRCSSTVATTCSIGASLTIMLGPWPPGNQKT